MRSRSRSLAGSGAVLVGATSGIGRAAACLSARQGARLVIAAHNADELVTVADECRELGAPAVVTCPTDISIPGDVARLGRTAREELGAVDVWVNTAAVLLAGDLTDTPDADIERIIATNVLGTALVTRAALPGPDGRPGRTTAGAVRPVALP